MLQMSLYPPYPTIFPYFPYGLTPYGFLLGTGCPGEGTELSLFFSGTSDVLPAAWGSPTITGGCSRHEGSARRIGGGDGLPAVSRGYGVTTGWHKGTVGFLEPPPPALTLQAAHFHPGQLLLQQSHFAIPGKEKGGKTSSSVTSPPRSSTPLPMGGSLLQPPTRTRCPRSREAHQDALGYPQPTPLPGPLLLQLDPRSTQGCCAPLPPPHTFLGWR